MRDEDVSKLSKSNFKRIVGGKSDKLGLEEKLLYQLQHNLRC